MSKALALREERTFVGERKANMIQRITKRLQAIMKGWKVVMIGGHMGACTTRIEHKGRWTYVKRYDFNPRSINCPIFLKKELRHPSLVSYRFINEVEYVMPHVGEMIDNWRAQNGFLRICHVTQIISLFIYLENRGLKYTDCHGGNICIQDSNLVFIDLESICSVNAEDINCGRENEQHFRKKLSLHNNKDYVACMLPYVDREWFYRAYDITSWRVDPMIKKEEENTNETAKSKQQENKAA